MYMMKRNFFWNWVDKVQVLPQILRKVPNLYCLYARILKILPFQNLYPGKSRGIRTPGPAPSGPAHGLNVYSHLKGILLVYKKTCLNFPSSTRCCHGNPTKSYKIVTVVIFSIIFRTTDDYSSTARPTQNFALIKIYCSLIYN